jgi:Spy/CpxP family protein refolding chaperone
MRSIVAAFILALAAAPAWANTPSPYAGQHHRPIKALSAEEIDDLRHGRGMGMAKAAELNSYPGPLHALQLRNELKLTLPQIKRIQILSEKMTREAKALGEAILQREAALDLLFRDGKASPAAVENATAEIGALQGRLRAVHLLTHLEMKALLEAEQVAAYDRLRGYAEASDAKPRGGHGGHKH